MEAFSSRPDTPWEERKRHDTSIRRLSHPAGREAKVSGRISLNSRSTAVERDRDRGSTDLSCRDLSLPSRENDVRPATSPWCEQIVASSQVSFHSRCLWTMPDDAKALVALLTITTWAVSRDPRIIGEIMITEQTWSMMLDSDVTGINEWVANSSSRLPPAQCEIRLIRERRYFAWWIEWVSSPRELLENYWFKSDYLYAAI